MQLFCCLPEEKLDPKVAEELLEAQFKVSDCEHFYGERAMIEAFLAYAADELEFAGGVGGLVIGTYSNYFCLSLLLSKVFKYDLAHEFFSVFKGYFDLAATARGKVDKDVMGTSAEVPDGVIDPEKLWTAVFPCTRNPFSKVRAAMQFRMLRFSYTFRP